MYKLTRFGDIQRLSDLSIIPPDNHAYLAWVAEGNSPTPVDPPSAAEVQTAADIASAKAHVKLNALKAMTPAQIQSWVTTNVTNLAQVQDAISTLAVAVGILARRI
jgi:hypothetical protein